MTESKLELARKVDKLLKNRRLREFYEILQKKYKTKYKNPQIREHALNKEFIRRVELGHAEGTYVLQGPLRELLRELAEMKAMGMPEEEINRHLDKLVDSMSMDDEEDREYIQIALERLNNPGRLLTTEEFERELGMEE